VKELAANANFRPGNGGSGNHNTGPPHQGGSSDGGSGSGTTEGADCTTENTNCIKIGCCKTAGHKCFMKDGTSAFCRSSSPAGWYGHEVIRSSVPNSGTADDQSRITTTTVAVQPGGQGTATDSTCSAAFGQCGGKNWNGPTCCQSGCRCRHEGDWYSQCEPPAGNHVCSAVVVLAEQAEEGPLTDGVGHVGGSLILAMAGVAMMFVLGTSVLAIKMAKQRRQFHSDHAVGETETMLSRGDVEAVE